jgi:hypothetical protein
MAQIRVDTVRQDYFVPFAGDGYSRVTGLTASDFAAKMAANGANVAISLLDDDANDPAAGEIKVKEVDGNGTYVIAYLADTAGEILVVMEYAAGTLRFSVEHDVLHTIPDAASTEVVNLQVNLPNATGAPNCSYVVRSSSGTRVLTGHVDGLGQATLPLAIANGYKIMVSRADLNFTEQTFNVADGGGTVTVTAKYTASVVMGGV